jgi:glycosyltransferase involved in cell wall biosynthesis
VPRVSVIVTCYRQGRYVGDCLDSIAAQTYRDFELLVYDDESGDDTPVVVQAWLDRADLEARLVVNNRNVGLTTTLNRALTQCRGAYVAYCGGDDLWESTKLERQVEVLDRAGPDTALVYADARCIDAQGDVVAASFVRDQGQDELPAGQVFDRLIRTNFVPTPTPLYRKEAIEAVGGWDLDLRVEDWDLLLRLADKYDFAAVDAVLASYRIHDESMTRREFSSNIESRLQVMTKWLGRDEATDDVVVPFLQAQSWRLFKVHPAMAREHVAVAYSRRAGVVGRLRRLVASSRPAEAVFEVLRRTTRLSRR